MVWIVFISEGGLVTAVDAAPGSSVMKAAVVNGVEGIEAECGGGLACATCHVYVDPSWQARLPPPAPDEDALLGATAAERKDCSRLCCQITVAEELEGLILRVPPSRI